MLSNGPIPGPNRETGTCHAVRTTYIIMYRWSTQIALPAARSTRLKWPYQALRLESPTKLSPGLFRLSEGTMRHSKSHSRLSECPKRLSNGQVPGSQKALSDDPTSNFHMYLSGFQKDLFEALTDPWQPPKGPYNALIGHTRLSYNGLTYWHCTLLGSHNALREYYQAHTGPCQAVRRLSNGQVITSLLQDLVRLLQGTWYEALREPYQKTYQANVLSDGFE
jgi:hypothetical protein